MSTCIIARTAIETVLANYNEKKKQFVFNDMTKGLRIVLLLILYCT